MGNARVTQQYVEALTSGDGKARIAQQYIEALTCPISGQVAQLYLEALTNSPNPEILRDASNTLSLTHQVDHEIHGSIFKNADNTLSLNQNVNIILELAVTSVLSFTQSVVRIFPVTAESVFNLSQDVLLDKYVLLSTDNNLVFTQTVAVEKILNRVINHTLVMTQLLNRNIINFEIANNTINLTQNVNASASKGSNNALTFSQNADVVLIKTSRNTLEFTQSVFLNTELNRSLISQFQPFQTVTIGPNTFRRDVNHTLSFTQNAVGNAVKGTTNTLTLTQSVTVHNVKAANNFFNPQQTVALLKVTNRSNSNILNFTQSASYNKVKGVSANNILSFEQNATKIKHIYLDVSDTFILSHELVNSRYLESITSNLIFTQDVNYQKEIRKDNPQSLIFQQTVLLNKVINLSASNVLLFKNSFEKYVGFQGEEDDDTITVPPAIGVVVKNIVVLRGTDHSITLPVPEFEDSDAFTGSINIVRFQTGGKKVYKTETERRILTYTFIIQSKKFDELKTFVKRYNSKPFYMDNWKGEIWYVRFNTNPFEFTEEAYWKEAELVGKNKYSVTLSFEGVRAN